MMVPTGLCLDLRLMRQGANPLGSVALALVLIGCGAVSPDPPSDRTTEEPSTSEAPTASAGPDAPAPEPTAPSALNLILDAHANGDLTDEEAAVYRAFAAFGDVRLPDEFRSDTGYDDGLALRAAAGMWDELSTANREALAPYFIPPMYAGSWADPAVDSTVSLAKHPARGPVALNPTDCASEQLRDQSYVNVPAIDGRVRIWWRDGIETSASFASAASAVAAEIDATIWPTLTGLMGQEPLSDQAQECFNGEDGALDIYLSDRTLEWGADAMTIAYPGRCTETPAFIIVAEDTVVDDGLPSWVVAHEVFHTIQYAYHYGGPCDAFTAMDEATAMWAARHTYPDDQFEWTGGTLFNPRSYADWFRQRENNLYWHGMTCYGYCGWPYFASVTERHGIERIADLYEATEAAGTDFEAIDAVTPGGFRGYWPRFVLDLFDDHPGWNVWRDWDPAPWSRLTSHAGGGGIPTADPGGDARWRFGSWETPCARAGEMTDMSLISDEILGQWRCVPNADQEETDLPARSLDAQLRHRRPRRFARAR